MRLAPLVLLAACGGDTPIAITFAKPAPAENFVRDTLGATGALSALVDVELAVDGNPTRLALNVGARAPVDLDLAGIAVAEIRDGGTITLTATAFDGEEIAATTAVDISVGDLALATCKEWLDVYRIDYTSGPAQPGVVDPVTAKMPINGVPFKVVGATNPRTTMFGDCRIIKSLAQAASFFRERDVMQVTDYGVYNYRCIGGGTPPNCPNGISQHAYAMAIDLAGFTTSDGAFMSVNDDWIIDPDSEETCEAPTIEGKDRWLHELICSLKAADVWNIVLTPNYNADHRNHFHVDLTPTSDFIERRDSPVHYH
jgi:hypothetical protein